MAGVEGADDFAEFAENTGNLADDVTRIQREALDETAEVLVDRITQRVEEASTPKGGTLDSRTSPYEPGGENSSSTDSKHISEANAWKTTVSGGSEPQITVAPKAAVEDRAYWLEKGTEAHGPDGDMPMYFKVNGMTIVVTDDADVNESDDGDDLRGLDTVDERDSIETFGGTTGNTQDNDTVETGEDGEIPLAERFDGEPGEVAGIDEIGFFDQAVLDIRAEGVLKQALEDAWEDALRRNFGSV